MIESFLVPFLTITAAELFDKSQLSLLLLATRTSSPLLLLTGSMLGFLIVDGIAVVIGAWITTVIPPEILSIIAGIVFVIFGILTLKDTDSKPKETKRSQNPLIAGFLTILLVEWGDKTQLATALFATQFNPVLVLIGTLTSLLLLSTLAVYLGKLLGSKIDKRKLNLVTGIVFLLIGAIFLLFR